MKKIIALLLSVALSVCMLTIGAEAKETNTERNTYEDRFLHYLYGEMADELGFEADYEKYEEVYYHVTQEGNPDWVIVNASETPEPEMCHGIFDYVALIECPSCSPFSLGLGVYDVQADTFYSFEEAWDMDFPELRKTFLDIMSGDKPISGYYQCRLLGDADKDGEISIIDATLIQRFDVRMMDLQDDELELEFSASVYGPDVQYISDFNCDGERDILDVTAIQRYLVGLS